MQLTFNEAEHCYRYGGVVVPSVTQLLEDDGQIVPNYPSGPYRVRGSRVHEATALWDADQLHNYEVGEEIQRYVASYALLMNELQWDWLKIEHRMFHSVLAYAGTADRIALRPLIADIKTGKTKRETGLQLAGYTILALADPDIRKAWGNPKETDVQRVKFELESDGSKAKATYYTDAVDFDVFRGLLAKYVWKRRK